MTLATRTVAIACQGGGSHCAFGAGALIGLLGRCNARGEIVVAGVRYRLTGISGTSGGAINALLVWYGLVRGSPAAGINALDGFWRDTMASGFWDAIANAAVVSAARWQGLVPSVEVAPNALSALAQDKLRAQLRKYVDFAALPALVRHDGPDLYIGAANVLSGAFTTFGGRGRNAAVGVEEVIASTAVPELFPAVKIGDAWYWDGLLSQNPPLRDFMRGRDKADIADEIWILRINPVARDGMPTSLSDIHDRRNEMAGNIALSEEMHFIGQVNRWVAAGKLPDKKAIRLREIALEEIATDDDGLDYASKLDRSPAFIDGLMRRGRDAASVFLAGSGL